MTGTYVLSAGYYDAYYLRAQKVRRLIADDFARAFKQVDVLMGPTSPTPAFDIGAKVDDPVTMYLNDIYTIGANLAGLPAMSIPCGFRAGCRSACRSSVRISPRRSCSTSRTGISARRNGTGAFRTVTNRQVGYEQVARASARHSKRYELGNSHRSGNPRAAGDAQQDLLELRQPRSAPRRTRKRTSSISAIRACCRC